MKRKYVLVIIFVMLFQSLFSASFFVEAKDDPEVCGGPSKTMTEYFDFQKEALNLLSVGALEERLLSVSFGSGYLFKNKVLKLSAIDSLASRIVGNVRSSTSNFITSSVLLLLISYSVLDSNFDGLFILFKDRPVVRDYKRMLDIETQLFDVAYSNSKKVNLIGELTGDIKGGIEELVKKYQEKGLLSNDIKLGKEDNMAGIITYLLGMNASMKKFISVGDESSKKKLLEYLSESAKNQLDKDYKDVRAFSVCNSYMNSFKNSINKTVKGAGNSLKTAGQDIKDATQRLKSALMGKGSWNFKNNRKNICAGIDEYQMAQLKAYFGPDWTCGGFVKVSGDFSDIASAISSTKKYFKEKKAQREKKKEEKKSESKSKSATIIQSQSDTSAKIAEWYEEFGSGMEYSPNFSSEIYYDFSDTFNEINVQYGQAQENAISSDVSDVISKGKGMLDQVKGSINDLKGLTKILQKISDKQCSG